MAAFGASASGSTGGASTQTDSGNLAVSGSDLALVVGAAEDSSGGSQVLTCLWDPLDNNESMTGTFATVSGGDYADAQLNYLDNPTAVTGVVRVDSSANADNLTVMGAFFTAAGDFVGGDTANDSFATTGSSLSSTVPNVVSGDMVCDIISVVGSSPGATAVVDSGQTQQETQSAGTYTNVYMSTQAGSVDGVMSWTISGDGFGGVHIAGRIPDGPSSGAGPRVAPLRRRPLLANLIR